jgi:hypothetical protein
MVTHTRRKHVVGGMDAQEIRCFEALAAQLLGLGKYGLLVVGGVTPRAAATHGYCLRKKRGTLAHKGKVRA